MDRGWPREAASNHIVPEQVFGYVSVKSKGGTSALEAEDLSDARPFHATKKDRDKARRIIDGVGLEVTAESRLGFAIAGRPDAYEELSGGKIVTRELLLHAEAGRRRYVTHLDITGKGQPPDLGVGRIASNGDELEGVLTDRPQIPQGVFPSPLARGAEVPPSRPRRRRPAAVCDAAHRGGHRGEDI